MSKKEKKYQLKFPSQSDNLEIIRDMISQLARRVGFGEDDINKIELAVDEACANVIKHAYKKQGKPQPIDIGITVDKDKFTITVSDKGKGFDVSKIKKPDMDAYIAEMRVGGLGIYLIQTLMDEVSFKSEPGKGNQVIMVKYVVNEKAAEKKAGKKKIK